MTLSLIRPFAALAILLAAVLVAASWSGGQAKAEHTEDLPIIFIHGGAGSAQQYQSQAQRFASNGYGAPVTAFEYNSANPLAVILGLLNTPLTNFIDDLRDETGADHVILIGHSFGTTVSNLYLNNAARAARVAKYIGIDGSSNADCGITGPTAHMECAGVFAGTTGNVGGNNFYFGGTQTHVQVASSAESFGFQYEFITGHPPATTTILPEPPGEVEISGRLVNFPQNNGVNGGVVTIWEVHDGTGYRKYADPVASFTVGPSGDWGPVLINGQQRYEFEVQRPEGDVKGHIYTQPFIRSNHLVRLLSAPATAGTVANTVVSPDHSAAVLVRNSEWWGNHPSGQDDILTVTTRIPSTGPVQVLEATPNILPGSGNGNIGIHIHDNNLNHMSDLNILPFFASQAFQTGFDVYMPATDPPTGTISFANAPRGDTSRMQVINTPNWESELHRLGIYFNDFVQDINTWGQCVRTPSCRVLVEG